MSDTQTLDPSNTTAGGLKENSLKTAGWAYLVGDAAFVASGLFDKSKNFKGRMQHAATGAYWGLGGLAAARYGNPKAEKQIELLCTRLGDYLEKQGITIPKSPKVAELTKHQGVVDNIEAFLYEHPSEVLNLIYALGAGNLITANFSKVRHGTADLSSKVDFATGVLVGAGSLAGILIPEKKPDPEHPAQGFAEKTKAWIQEKPLRLSAAFFWGGNAAMTYGAIAKRSEAIKSGSGDKSYLWRFLIAGSYIFANTMLSLSSKGHAADSKNDITPQLAEISATIIAAQHPKVQEDLVQNIAGYLSAQPEIKKTAPEIAELLHNKLAEVQKSLPVPGKWESHVQKGAESTVTRSF